MMFQSVMLVGLGGMIGSMARYLVGYLFKTHSLPFGTLLVNLTGSLLIGFLRYTRGMETFFSSRFMWWFYNFISPLLGKSSIPAIR